MTVEKFEGVCNVAFDAVRRYTPIDTGNLRYNATNMEYVGNNKCNIYVDESIAPYMPYTNEPWKDKRWKGKKNPNEHWWQDTAKDVAQIIADELGGKVKEL